MGMKYAPKACGVGQDDEVFFQHTLMEEAGRKRFIDAYREPGCFSTVDFVRRAITCFGHTPQIVQTDNDGGLCHAAKTKRIYPWDVFCMENGIAPQALRP